MEDKAPLQCLAESGLFVISETGFDLKRSWPSRGMRHCEFSEIRRAVWKNRSPQAISITTTRGKRFSIDLSLLSQKACHQNTKGQTAKAMAASNREALLELIRMFRRKIPVEVQQNWNSFWKLTWDRFGEEVSKEERKQPDYKRYQRLKSFNIRVMLFLGLIAYLAAFPFVNRTLQLLSSHTFVTDRMYAGLFGAFFLVFMIACFYFGPESVSGSSLKVFEARHMESLAKIYKRRRQTAWHRSLLALYILMLLYLVAITILIYLRMRHVHAPTDSLLERWCTEYFWALIAKSVMLLLFLLPVYGMVPYLFTRFHIDPEEQAILRLAEREFDVDLGEK